MNPLEELTVGKTFTKTIVVSAEHVKSFAEATGDFNPIHFDEDAAQKAGFKGPIAHGQLVVAMANPLLTDEIDGIVLRQQSVEFSRGILVGAEVIITATIASVIEKQRMYIVVWGVAFSSEEKKCFTMTATTWIPKTA